ncbi:MAG: ABC transporter substrate-binding protein, partial [Lachnospiraceae bacterium]
MRRKIIIAICLFLTGLLGLHGCGSPSSNYDSNYHTDNLQDKETEDTLVYESSMELQYAENFSVDYYKGGYTMLTTTMDGQRFLVVPEGKEIPENMQEDIVVLQRPMKDLYLVASAVMDMFRELDGLNAITFSGQKEENWYIEEAKEAM